MCGKKGEEIMKKNILALSIVGSLIFGGVAGYIAKPTDEIKFLDGNAGAIQWLINSGESEALQYQAYNVATESLKMKVNQETEKPKAVVLDIDETVFSNFGSTIEDYLTGEGYSKERFTAWCSEERASLIAGAGEFLQTAEELGVEVFYITNRYPEDLDYTINNMKALGLPNADAEHVLIKTDSSKKADRIAIVEETHEIIMFVGDNLNDFPEGFDKKSNEERKALVGDVEDKFGTDYIIIPNPTYGDWEGATFNYDYSKTDAQKIQDRNEALQKVLEQ